MTRSGSEEKCGSSVGDTVRVSDGHPEVSVDTNSTVTDP